VGIPLAPRLKHVSEHQGQSLAAVIHASSVVLCYPEAMRLEYKSLVDLLFGPPDSVHSLIERRVLHSSTVRWGDSGCIQQSAHGTAQPVQLLPEQNQTAHQLPEFLDRCPSD